MASRIRIRRGTTAQWTASTKILESGEFGMDTTLTKIKIGNGTSLWNDLPFLHIAPWESFEVAQDAVGQSLSAGTGLVKTYDDPNNTIILSLDSTIANKTYVDTAVSGLGNTSSTTYVPLSFIGNIDGVASLDENGKIPDSEIPATIARDTEIPSSTSSLSEGTNLYFTDERAQDAVGNSVGNGLSYNDTTGAVSVDTSIISTKTYADSAATAVFNNILDSAPAALNTLNELAAAINDDQSFATTITTALGTKLNTSTAVSDYLKITDASSTYLTSSSASTNYLQKTQPSIDYQIFNSGTGGYLVNGVFNGPITLIPGKPHRISVQAPGHPFWFQTSYGPYTLANVYTTGIENSGTDAGQIVILLPTSAPQLYYVCQNHSTMKGAVLFDTSNSLTVFTNQTGSYTPVLMDMGKVIEMSGGGTFTITDSESFPVGTSFEILQAGSSQVTIAGNGFTPNSTPGLKLRTQWSSATVIKRALNSWVVFGDLSA
jgi:hypothetical protein